MKAGSLSRVKRVSFEVRGCFFVAGSTCRCCIRCGGLPDWSPADRAAVVSAGVACLLCRLLPLPLGCFVAPIPPAPFPAGRGRLLVFLCKGLDGARHWLDLRLAVPCGGLNPSDTCSPCPGGEDHLKRRRRVSDGEFHLPRSPLSLAAGTANRKAVLSVLRQVGDSEGTPLRTSGSPPLFQCRPGSAPGMQGASPLA